MSGDALLRHCQSLRDDPAFRRWDSPDYIPLSAVAAPPGLPWDAVLGQIDDAPPPEDAVSALRHALARDDGRLIAALGPPFCGQTSVMRRLAWLLAETPARAAPIFVPLARYAAQPAGGRRLARVIAESAGVYAPDLAAAVDGLLARAAPEARGQADLSGERLVFILDGLDEVQRQLRDDLARELLELSEDQRLAAHRFVISCRREALPPAIAGRARLLLLQYLSGREVLRYVRSRRGSPAQANARFGQIIDARLLDMAALPPLLAAILQRLEGDRNSPLGRSQI
ncbi:MAG: hypothetical protein WCI67_11595, partial [Chloroflexales bacterium]